MMVLPKLCPTEVFQFHAANFKILMIEPVVFMCDPGNQPDFYFWPSGELYGTMHILSAAL
jgi:hypothetical protein